jgi:ubiquinone/menaquinone biosynthesis C-methylase UbiE
MVHKDHVNLIIDGIGKSGGVWADLGSGSGAFTLALRDVAGEAVKIYSVDQDRHSLEEQKQRFSQMFPGTDITYVVQSFVDPIDLPLLDGIIMANSLHYVEEQSALLKSIRKYLKPHGKLVLIEYNDDMGNQWVPYPVDYEKFITLASQSGFEPPKLLGKIPSQFLKEIYSAVTLRLS